MVIIFNSKSNRKIVARVFSIFLIATFLMNGIHVSYVKAATKYHKTKYNISLNKVWKVKFSKEVDPNTVNTDNVKVLNREGKEMPIDVALDVDKRCIKVALKNGTYDGQHYNGKYDKEEKYTLVIGDGLKSKAKGNEKSKKLLNEVKMDFNTQGDNPYPGLPVEDGIIVIGDKAYSVGYLEKNSALANEIFTNGNYVISYISDEYGEKIKQILGDKESKGTVERAKIINYYAPDKKVYEYEWNDSVGEYKLVLPKAFVNVIPGSNKGVVSLSVIQTRAVPGAKYFKLQHSNVIKKIGDTIVYATEYPVEKLTILSEDETPLANALVNVLNPDSIYVSLNLIGETLGNTSGNISNNGCAAMDSDLYAYYVNTADKSTLYKKDLTGKRNIQIVLDKVQYINVMGDWLYFSNYDDNGKIYKCKKDGTQKQVLCDDTATYITVANNEIYYSNQSDKGRLYKINTDATIDGTTVNKDPSGKVHGTPVVNDFGNYNKAYDEVSFINIVGDWIYYSNFSQGHKIYAVNKNGNIRRKVNDEWADGIQIVGSWAYYCSGKGVISKVRIDGKGGVVPIKGTTRQVDKAYHLNIVDDWIYYSNAEDKGKLYKIKADGTGEKKKLADITADYINIVGDIIYITSGSSTYTLPLNTNGTIPPVLVTKDSIQNNIIDSKDLDITVRYEDANKPINKIEAKYLPGKTAVFMKDDTVQQLTVDWDTKNKKYNGQGIYTYEGTILGYGKKIKCKLTIPSEMLNANSIIEVYNNGPKNGSIIIRERNFGNSIKDLEEKAKLKGAKRVEIGDIIKVYDSPNSNSKPLGQVRVDANNANGPLVKGLDLDMYGRSFWITITRKDRAESKATEVRQLGAPIITGDVLDPDNKALGVDGRDFEIQGWNNPSIRGDGFISDTTEITAELKKYIYLVPGNGKLNMENSGVNNVGETKGNHWIGSNARDLLTGYDLLMIDSLNNKLKEGDYSTYVSSAYEGRAEDDVNGFGSPLVKGRTASVPKIIKAIEEKVPKQPSVSKQYVKPGEAIKMPQMQKGETAFLAPVGSTWIACDLTNEPFKSHDNVFFKVESNENEEDPNNGIPAIESGFQGELINGNVVPKSIKNGRYKVYILNDIGSSKESSGEIVVDKEPPVVKITDVKYNMVPVKDKDGKVVMEGTNPKMRIGSVTVRGKAMDNEDGTIRTYLVSNNTVNEVNIIKTSAIQNAGNNFTFTINVPEDNTDKAPETFFGVYAIDAAENLSQLASIDKNKIFDEKGSGIRINMIESHIGKDLVTSKISGRTPYKSKDLTGVAESYAVYINGERQKEGTIKGGIRYELNNKNIRKLGTNPSIDEIINALSQAKETEYKDGKWVEKEIGSVLKDKLKIYKINGKICMETRNTDEAIDIEDKTTNNILSEMIGIDKNAHDKGLPPEAQEYKVIIGGSVRDTLDKPCKLRISMVGKYFDIILSKGETADVVAGKIKDGIEQIINPSNYKVDLINENGNKVIKLERQIKGAVVPKFSLISMEYNNDKN